MKRLALVSTVLCAASLTSKAQTPVFTDNFSNGSTINGASTPGGTSTASYTSYDIAASKDARTGPSITSGKLTLKLNSGTTSGFIEAQARFATTPVALSSIGDFIGMAVVFTNSSGTVLAGGTSSFLIGGLYNSAGNAPVAGSLNNSGLNATTGSAYATGNCANWSGLVARISNGGTSQIYTRPTQTGAGTTSANQDLVGNSWGGGAYNNPTGTSLGTTTTAVPLTSGGVYTMYLQLTLASAGTITVSNSLWSGTSIGGTSLFSEVAQATGANFINTFDGLCVGIRNSGTSMNPTMDISSIQVTVIPEPATLAVLGVAATGWIARRRRN